MSALITSDPQITQSFLEGALDAELTLYTQKQVLARMNNTYNNLGKAFPFQKPRKKEPETNIVIWMCHIGAIFGVLFGIIMAVVEYQKSGGGFWYFLWAIIYAIIMIVLGFIGGGLTLGLLGGYLALLHEQKKIDQAHQEKLAAYQTKCNRDAQRVKSENRQKAALRTEIVAMQRQIEESEEHLRTIYSYGVLAHDYQNIYAVSSIYDYFKKGRTRSLSFDPITGDQGAYNIFEYERKMNYIILNTQEILCRLEEISQRQYELAQGLQRAQGEINSLCSGLHTHMQSASRSLAEIERCQAVIAYNSERTQQQLAFMGWLQALS